MTIADLRDWLSFIVLLVAAITAVTAVTPKGATVFVKVFNWFDRNVWHKHLYAEIRRLDLRIDDHESLDHPELLDEPKPGGFV